MMVGSNDKAVRVAVMIWVAVSVSAMMLIGEGDAAITSCGQVSSSVAPCFPYLRGAAKVPPACCSGIKSLNAAAKSTADRQLVCRCLKSAARNVPGLNLGKAASIPGQCGVSVPFPITPSVDCSKIG